MIGLMMIKDETDMLEEALRNHSIFCDEIYVLDGTEGPMQPRSEAICRSFARVAGYWRDAETRIPRPLRDGARGFLLHEARRAHGIGRWYAVLHGDEIWSADPRVTVLDRPDDADACSVLLYHFFPHVSERTTWDYVPFVTSIEACASHYMLPGIPEHRLFFDTGRYDYEIPRHSRVIPVGMRVWHTELAVKQYNYRNPDQAHTRAVTRRADGWQANHYQHLLDGTDGFFVETLASETHKWAGIVPIGQGDVADIATRPLPYLGRHDPAA